MCTMTFVHPTADSTRAELAECLLHLNERAKELSRRGYSGTRSQAYELTHANLNVLLTTWQLASA